MQVKIGMNKSLLLLFFVLHAFDICAQEFMVKSFNVAENDISAQVQPRMDLNDKNCALVKVGIALEGVQFEGNILGNVIHKLGEYWVYMPQGNSMLRISHRDYTPLMVNFYDYRIGKLESGKTYVLTLVKPNNSSVPKYSQKQTQMYNIIVKSSLKTTLFGGIPCPLKGLMAYVN